MKKTLYVFIAVLIILTLVSCGSGETEKKVMNIEYVTNADGSTSTLYNGQGQEFFNVTETQPQTVEINVKKVSGELEIKIFNTEDETDIQYEGHEFPSESFTVKVTDAGRYVIVVTCKNFIGEYNFDYDLSIGN